MKITREKVESSLDTVVEALNFLDSITSSGLVHDAAAVGRVVAAVMHSLHEKFNGQVTDEYVKSHLKSLHDSLALNDATADAALDQKFDLGTD